MARFPDASVTDGSPYDRPEEVNTDPPSQVGRRVAIALAIVVPIAAILGLTILARRAGW